MRQEIETDRVTLLATQNQIKWQIRNKMLLKLCERKALPLTKYNYY